MEGVKYSVEMEVMATDWCSSILTNLIKDKYFLVPGAKGRFPDGNHFC